MQVVLKGKNVELTDTLRSYVDKRIGKLDRYLDNITETTVELTREMTRSSEKRHSAQVTMLVNGAILRGEEKAQDVLAAVDAVADVMNRQIKRYKGKLYEKHKTKMPAKVETAVATTEEPITGEDLEEEELESFPDGKVVKRKRYSVKPMFYDEAIEQMELLGHDFFVYYDAGDEQVNVVYRRKDGDYGLITPEMG
ncbi:MAG: ribosome-associated translation inhibitor RaiA [Chloroflexota bacterium]|nr:MAG: ribosome-associated translation inhibitor RaiA [Chloroflexota bacterium]